MIETLIGIDTGQLCTGVTLISSCAIGCFIATKLLIPNDQKFWHPSSINNLLLCNAWNYPWHCGGNGKVPFLDKPRHYRTRSRRFSVSRLIIRFTPAWNWSQITLFKSIHRLHSRCTTAWHLCQCNPNHSFWWRLIRGPGSNGGVLYAKNKLTRVNTSLWTPLRDL